MIIKPQNGPILILGAKSKIAKEISMIYAKNSYDLILAGRDIDKELKTFILEIKKKNHINIFTLELDILNFSKHQLLYDSLEIKPQGVISFIGLTDNQLLKKSNELNTKIIRDTNFLGIVNFLDILINDFKKKKNSWIMVVTSILTDRSTEKNKFYASYKIELNKYLEIQRGKKVNNISK